MPESSDENGFELSRSGEVLPIDFQDALAHPLFLGGTLDVFIGDTRYRIPECEASFNGRKLEFLTTKRPTILRYAENKWMPAALRTLHFYLSHISHRKIIYDREHKVILMYFTEGCYKGLPVRAVLYPLDRPPRPESLRIVGFTGCGDLIVNGSFKPYIVR